ncbi:YdcH family protein [uncultured Photobacterium sp.]|uniref:YdcH family protein n=1 Tax=uncultured Photobacterium sp. TaxID=173973 RepID=UPI002609A5D2|nr:YdcH family protein [uncultured Photobacterium sp.]
MLGENHALFIEFPEMQDKIQELKMVDESFKAMSDRYHQLDHTIRGLESNNVPTEDSHFTQLKLERLQLKDKIYSILTN